MGSAGKELFKNVWQPQLQFVRYRHKINITKPRPPHYEKALLETLCIPYFNIKKKPHIPDYDACNVSVVKKVKEDHPLKIILARESLERFQNSKLIAFFHMNSINAEEKFQYQLLLKKKNMKFFLWSKHILATALKGTIYEPVLHLYEGPTVTVTCPKPDMHSLQKILKKMPKLFLMGAVVENNLLGVTDLKKYGKFQDIMEARVALLSVLNSASQSLVQQINHHPSALVELLNQHKKLLEGSDSKS